MPDVEFVEQHEPGWREAPISEVLVFQDEVDSGLVRVHLCSQAREPRTTRIGETTRIVVPHVVECEAVMPLRGFREFCEELVLILDANPPDKRIPIRDLARAHEEGTTLLESAPEFRRIFAHGSSARASGENVLITFWSRRTRTEKGPTPVIVEFVEFQAAVPWTAVVATAHRIPDWLARVTPSALTAPASPS